MPRSQLMSPAGQRKPVFKREQIARDRQIAAIVASREAKLRLRIGGALPPTTTAPTGWPNKKPGTVAAGVPGVGSPVKK